MGNSELETLKAKFEETKAKLSAAETAAQDFSQLCAFKEAKCQAKLNAAEEKYEFYKTMTDATMAKLLGELAKANERLEKLRAALTQIVKDRDTALDENTAREALKDDNLVRCLDDDKDSGGEE